MSDKFNVGRLTCWKLRNVLGIYQFKWVLPPKHPVEQHSNDLPSNVNWRSIHGGAPASAEEHVRDGRAYQRRPACYFG